MTIPINEQIMLIAFEISRLIRKFDTDTHPDELSMIQVQALSEIAKTNQTISSIAKKLHIKLPTASVLINRLADAEYVKRSEGKKDRRTTYIFITIKGTKALHKVRITKKKRVNYILNALSLEEKKNLLHIVQNIYTKLQKKA